MVKLVLIITSLFSFGATAATNCRDLNKVAKEAVAYAVLGAWETFTTHACFKKEKYQYFRPELGYPTGEVNDTSAFMFFDKKKDSYTIQSVTLQGETYDIAVRFQFGTNSVLTHYTYRPSPEYASQTGACGYVVNYEHGIFRKDCVIPSRLPASK